MDYGPSKPQKRANDLATRLGQIEAKPKHAVIIVGALVLLGIVFGRPGRHKREEPAGERQASAVQASPVAGAAVATPTAEEESDAARPGFTFSRLSSQISASALHCALEDAKRWGLGRIASQKRIGELSGVVDAAEPHSWGRYVLLVETEDERQMANLKMKLLPCDYRLVPRVAACVEVSVYDRAGLDIGSKDAAPCRMAELRTYLDIIDRFTPKAR